MLSEEFDSFTYAHSIVATWLETHGFPRDLKILIAITFTSNCGGTFIKVLLRLKLPLRESCS